MKFAKMGAQDLNFGFVQDVAHALLWSSGGGGVGGCDNVLEEYYTWPIELVAVVNMLHMLAYGHQGGCDNVLDEYLCVGIMALHYSLLQILQFALIAARMRLVTFFGGVVGLRRVGDRLCGRGLSQLCLVLSPACVVDLIIFDSWSCLFHVSSLAFTRSSTSPGKRRLTNFVRTTASCSFSFIPLAISCKQCCMYHLPLQVLRFGWGSLNPPRAQLAWLEFLSMSRTRP